MRPGFLAFIACISLLFTDVSRAEAVSRADIAAITGALRYVRGLSALQPFEIVVLYDAAIPSTKVEAEAFRAEAESEQVRARLQALDALGGLGASVLYIPSGMEAHYEQIASYAKAQHLFTVTKTKSCVVSPACIVSVRTDAGIEIFVNENNLRNLGFEVDAAFKFMAKRV